MFSPTSDLMKKKPTTKEVGFFLAIKGIGDAFLDG